MNTIGCVIGDKEKDIENIEYLGFIKIVDESKKVKVDKFATISGALIERPWNPISVILNSLCPNAFHYKLLAENYLRTSGLNYLIVRPP